MVKVHEARPDSSITAPVRSGVRAVHAVPSTTVPLSEVGVIDHPPPIVLDEGVLAGDGRVVGSDVGAL